MTPEQEFFGFSDADLVTLDEMIAACRKLRMTPEQEAEQRRSFVYGNCHLENESVTREMVDEADKLLHPDQQKSE